MHPGHDMFFLPANLLESQFWLACRSADAEVSLAWRQIITSCLQCYSAQAMIWQERGGEGGRGGGKMQDGRGAEEGTDA